MEAGDKVRFQADGGSWVHGVLEAVFQGEWEHYATVRVDHSTYTVLLGDLERDEDGDLLGRMGTDAQKWAAEFVRVFQEVAVRPEPTDLEGMMIGWFANAIEAGAARERALALEAEEAEERVRRRAFGLDPDDDLQAVYEETANGGGTTL
jgi:hypothetical protein